MRCIIFVIALVAVAASSPATATQPAADRKQARLQNQLGWEQMGAEQWAGAARSFQRAIEFDPTFEIPYYGLGRAKMAIKQFVEAIDALSQCQGLFRARAGRQFTTQQEAQRYRNDRLTELDEQIRQLQSMPPSARSQELLRQLSNQRRDIHNAVQRGNSMTIDATVPPWVSLSLGSAYFRAGRLADAEREYKATVAADDRSGEAHSNLAVVYLETGRFGEAYAALQAAKTTGFKVNPELERAIRERVK